MRFAGCSILVCEDEPLVALDLEQALTQEGATILGPASHREQAHNIVQHTVPDAALLDLVLLDGYCTDVAEVLAAKGVPVAVVTVHNEPAVLPEALANARWFIKPFSTADVLDYLASAIQSKRGN